MHLAVLSFNCVGHRPQHVPHVLQVSLNANFRDSPPITRTAADPRRRPRGQALAPVAIHSLRAGTEERKHALAAHV